jgi:catechol O-methyltransferase
MRSPTNSALAPWRALLRGNPVRTPFNVNSKNFTQLLRFAGQEAWRFSVDRLRGAPPRVEQALAFARAHARAGDPESVLQALDRFGREHSFLMNVGDRKGEILDAEVRSKRPARALEIGAFCGYSAVRIARLLREWDGRLVSIEASGPHARVARAMLELAGLADLVEVLHAKAEEAIPSLGAPFELTFIDHWKDLYLPDLRRLEKHGLLLPGSVVIADNVGLFDASAYFEHVRGSGRYDSRNVASTVEYHDELPDAVEISVFRG